MRNATHGASICSRRCSGDPESSGAPGVATIGIVAAANTPATVGWIPESRTAYQRQQARIR
jgi:hypothetical protein